MSEIQPIPPMTDALNLVLYIAAANQDATPEQRDELRVKVLPAMERYKLMELDEPDVKAFVRSIMGDGWEPGPEWSVR